MKKIILALVILVANMSLISCTDTSLAEAQEEFPRTYAVDSIGSLPIDPPPDPPGGN